MSEMNNSSQTTTTATEKKVVYFNGVEEGRISKDNYLRAVTLPLFNTDTNETQYGQFYVLASAIKPEEKQNADGKTYYWFAIDETPIDVTLNQKVEQANEEGKIVYENITVKMLPSEIKTKYLAAIKPEVVQSKDESRANTTKQLAKVHYLNRLNMTMVQDSKVNEHMKNVNLYFPDGRIGSILVSDNCIYPAAIFYHGKKTNRVFTDRVDVILKRPTYDVRYATNQKDENGKPIYETEKAVPAEKIVAAYNKQIKEYKKGFTDLVKDAQKKQHDDQSKTLDSNKKTLNRKERE